MSEIQISLGQDLVQLGIGNIPEYPRLPITPKVEHYGRVPFDEAFDVPQILNLAITKYGLPQNKHLYLVDFASQAKPESDRQHLTDLDNAAHHEAALSDGFLLYFRGDLDPDNFTRSFCLWQNSKFAKIASHKPAHRAAAAVAETMYDYYKVTMRGVWLEESEKGFKFGPEAIHSVGKIALAY